MTRAHLAAAFNGLFSLLALVGLDCLAAEPASNQRPGKIAFVANLDVNWDVFVMDADGTHPVQVTTTSVDERSPSLAPDGKKIVYATTDGQLWIVDLNTRQSAPLSLPKGQYYHSQWHPDGNAIVFSAYEFAPGREDADIWIYPLNAKEPTPLLTQTGVQDYAGVSPGGDRLLYACSVSASLFGISQENFQQLWIAGLSDGTVRQLLLPSGQHTQPRWSPNGERIAFSSNMGGHSHIWTAKADGTGLQQITNGPGADTSPAWSPDGREIVFVSTRSGHMELWIVCVDTKQIRKLSPFGDRPIEAKDPDWR